MRLLHSTKLLLHVRNVLVTAQLLILYYWSTLRLVCFGVEKRYVPDYETNWPKRVYDKDYWDFTLSVLDRMRTDEAGNIIIDFKNKHPVTGEEAVFNVPGLKGFIGHHIDDYIRSEIAAAPVHITLMPAQFIFVIGTFIFISGMLGVFYHNRTFIMVLVKAELMYLGINLLFVGMAVYYIEPACFVYSLMLFGIVAAESVLGLCLFFTLLLTDHEVVLYDVSDVVEEWQ